MPAFKIGQKWISNAEPELGMGRVQSVDGRTVTLLFDLADAERTYAGEQAPLTRVRFIPGDSVTTRDNVSMTVDEVIEKDGILVYRGRYQGTNTSIVETELDPNIRFSKPQDRLYTRQIDDNEWFNLRYHSLINSARLAASRFRGLYGPRVSLIPHQLYIAGEVASRFAPRVLLADEVGLGKTIEAGLIIHQQSCSSFLQHSHFSGSWR
jgi:ATP-dependent helicase HepA